MAARALSTGTPAVIRSRLTTTAPNPHWRNTWVFAAGRLFSDGNDEACDMVLEVVEDFDNLDRWPGWLLPIGPELAAALIDDGLAASTPRWQSRLLDVLLRTLSGHLPRDVQELSIALATVTADTGTLLRVRDALKTALAGSQSCQAVACMLWQQTPIGSHLPQLPPDPGRFDRLWRASPPEGTPTSVGELLRPALREMTVDEPAQRLVDDAIAELDDLRMVRTSASELWPHLATTTKTWPATAAALSTSDPAAMLELAFEALDPVDWTAAAATARAMWPEFTRRPVGDELDTQV